MSIATTTPIMLVTVNQLAMVIVMALFNKRRNAFLNWEDGTLALVFKFDCQG